MKYIHKYILAFSLIVLSSNIFAQNFELPELIQIKIEEIVENSELEYDYTEVYEQFVQLYQNPININSATRKELSELLVLDDFQIESLIKYRINNGYILSLYELKNIEGFNVDLIKFIAHFLSFSEPEEIRKEKFSNRFKYGKHDIMIRWSNTLEEKKGFKDISDSALAENPNARYLGSEDALLFRYTYRYKDQISWSLIGDKDAGEEFFKGSNKYGFDFYSSHLKLGEIGRVKKVIIGDFNAEFGQGLTLWSGFGFGKSIDATNIRKYGRGIRASGSANEFSYFRGIASQIEITDNIDFYAFYSNKNRDASFTPTDTLDDNEYIINSIQEIGYHRTANEIAKERKLNEQTIGSRIEYKKNSMLIGLSAQYIKFNKNIIQDSSLYKKFNFIGDNNYNYGLDFSYTFKKLLIFGESSFDKEMDNATVAGVVFKADPRLLLSILYRNYQSDYNNFYSLGFAESSATANEEGVYAGAKLFIGENSIIRTYYDIFRFPWLRYRVNLPSYGNEFAIQYDYNFNRYSSFYLRYKNETKAINESDYEGIFKNVLNRNKQSLRFNFAYQASHKLSLISRFELASYQLENKDKSKGYLVMQDLKYKLFDEKLKLYFRYALFNTDDYDSRVYAYENDVLYYFYIPAYSNQGQRVYLMASYKATRNLSFWLKIANTFYNDKDVIGSGLNEIQANHKTDIRLQMRLRF